MILSPFRYSLGVKVKFILHFFFQFYANKIRNLVFHVVSKCPSLCPPSSILNIFNNSWWSFVEVKMES